MLWVCASSTDIQYATTGMVKDALRITTTSDDALIDAAISRASAWAEQYVGYPLGRQVYGELVPGQGRTTLLLARTPIRGITRIYATTATSEGIELKSSEYRITDREAGIIERQSGLFAWTWQGEVGLAINPLPGQERKPWFVTYEAGYLSSGGSTSTEGGSTSTGKTMPADIEQAVVIKAADLYRNRLGVKERRVGDLAITYNSERDDGPAERLLAPYRRVNVA